VSVVERQQSGVDRVLQLAERRALPKTIDRHDIRALQARE